ncbi:glucodextranase DOMON-like domain-containing protein [Bacteroidota bacterium]
MKSYVSALKTGNRELIYKYWTDVSTKRPGFNIMHATKRSLIPIYDWPDFLGEGKYTFALKEVNNNENYSTISFQWIKINSEERAESNTHEMILYLVKENYRWLFINPIDLLTKDWKTYETETFRFIYPAEFDVMNYVAEIGKMESDTRYILDVFNVNPNKKIEYYKVRTPEECGKLISHPPANGYAANYFKSTPDSLRFFDVLISTSFRNLHEATHLFTSLAGIKYVSAAYTEGLAVAFGGSTFQEKELSDYYSKSLLNTKEFIPLSDLLSIADNNFLRQGYKTYQEAGSFFRFLTEKYGFQKLALLGTSYKDSVNVISAFESKYDMDIYELEQGWIEYLNKIKFPEIRNTIPEKAQTVFSLNDPLGDDLGDGDYSYPERFPDEEGAFDILKFEIFKDETNLYFKIKLNNLIKPVDYNFTEERFMPGVVIAIQKGVSDGRKIQRFFDGISLEDNFGYDIKLTVGFGISFSNNFGKVYMCTSDISRRIFNYEENTITFSVPIEIMDDPGEDWYYFVGTGLISDRTMNFYGGPMEVRKDHPIFISGGNYTYGNPAYIDLLLPGSYDQTEILNNYDPQEGKFARIPMITLKDAQ